MSQKVNRTVPRILLVCTGYKSNLFSSIACARTLRTHGFDVVFAAPLESSEWISAQKFEHVVIPHAQCNAFSGDARKFDYGFPTSAKRRKRSEQAANRVLQEGFAEVLSDLKPDLVLSDCEHHSAILQTRASGTPIALLAFMFMSPPGPTSPPLTSDIVPGRGLRGTPAGIWFSWRAFHFKWNSKLWANRLKYWGADFASTYRALARHLEIPLDDISTRKSFQAPWSYGLPTLYLLPGALQLPVEMPEQHVFVGPQALMERAEAEPSDEVTAFISETERKKVFVSFGTVRHAPRRIFDKLILIAQRHPEWHFLIATPQVENVMQKHPPENFSAVPWVPQIEVLQAADCVIFHGGAATMIESLLTRTPMLVIPNGLDGKGNGARVAFHGLGLANRSKVSAKTLERQIGSLLSDTTYAINLSRKQEQIGSQSDLAARFILGVLKEKRV